jgi:hypothetical protein
MRNLGMNPEVVACIQDAQEVLAFGLPESERTSFLLFHDFITNPQPRFITEWRASLREERWYHALLNGLNWATRNAYSCVIYYCQRLSDLESEVMDKISKRNYASALGNSIVGIGNTHVWDFEYQAFIFAYRRCLDYMTRGLAAFFKSDFHSFNSLPKSLKKLKPQGVADALAEVHKKHCANFAFVMSADGKRSVRDKIAHYEWVQAGTINLTRHGFIMIGGGEALPPTTEHNTARLTEALALRVKMLKACIDEMLTVFVTEARAWEAKRATEPM